MRLKIAENEKTGVPQSLTRSTREQLTENGGAIKWAKGETFTNNKQLIYTENNKAKKKVRIFYSPGFKHFTSSDRTKRIAWN